MATGYEVEYYQHIRNIDQSLNRIANCMEAAEKRARVETGIKATTPEDIEQMGKAIKAVVRGFAEMEADRVAIADGPPNAVEDWRMATRTGDTDLSFTDWLEFIQTEQEVNK